MASFNMRKRIKSELVGFVLSFQTLGKRGWAWASGTGLRNGWGGRTEDRLRCTALRTDGTRRDVLHLQGFSGGMRPQLR